MIQIKVFGEPAAQGSKRHVGHGRMIEQSKKVAPWRQAVAYAAVEAMGGAAKGISGPIHVEMIFTLHKPKSAPKTRRTYPDKSPDLDKCCRSTFDSLTTAGAWEDDARVISLHASKVFPGESADALPVPGAIIRIYSITEHFERDIETVLEVK